MKGQTVSSSRGGDGNCKAHIGKESVPECLAIVRCKKGEE